MGNTYPNPLVGSVIIVNNTIIGEGWHRKAGMPHAEVNAINAVKDKSQLKKATLYVNLEPCSHYGKTPPCSELIINTGIKNVVIGTIDPNVNVSGNGIKKMMAAGCNVTVGILQDECNGLNKRFFTYHKQKRPYIILKWAQSADNFISPSNNKTGKPVWISNQYSRQLVHKWRSEEQAILVGTNTITVDNPKLTTRAWHGNNPIRVIIDRTLKTYSNYNVWDDSTETICITDIKHRGKLPLSIDKTQTLVEFINFSEDIIEQIAAVLYRLEIQSIIIEGGAKTIQAFIDSALWDEARIFKSTINLKLGIKAPEISGKIITQGTIANDTLKIIRNNDR